MKILLSLAVTVSLCLTFFCSQLIAASTKGGITPSVNDKCPVCGMFVFKYPDWTAYVKNSSGTMSFFDGPKDMFIYYFSPESYGIGRKGGAIKELFVKDYYSLKMIDAKTAFFVIGSDVYGPMGNELIPCATQKDAADFMKDHRGKKILRFNEITNQLIKKL